MSIECSGASSMTRLTLMHFTGTSTADGERVVDLEVGAGKAMQAGVGLPLFLLAGEDMGVQEASRGRGRALEEDLMLAVEVVAMEVVAGEGRLTMVEDLEVGKLVALGRALVVLAGMVVVKALDVPAKDLVEDLERLHHQATKAPERRSK